MNFKYNIIKTFYTFYWGLGIGDWGLGIGDWAQSPIPKPQSPIPKFNHIPFNKYNLIQSFLFPKIITKIK